MSWRAQATAVVAALVVCLAHLVVNPASKDFASGDFRARLFGRGVYWWNLHWFGGHSLPGYGVLPPMLGSFAGVTLVSMVSLVVASWAFAMIVHAWAPPVRSPTLASVVFVLAAAETLWGGRLTFGPSVAFGMLCVLAYARRRVALAVVASFCCGLSSPVGALALLLVAAALWVAGLGPRRASAAVAVAATLPPGLVALAFPEQGWYPFTGGGLVTLLAALLVLVVARPYGRTVAIWVAIYALAAVGAFVVRSALGGNIVRLGWLLCAPLAVACWQRWRRTLLPIYVAAVLAWGWSYVELGLRPRQASADASYFASLANFVRAQPGGVSRVEVVPVDTMRQADELALQIHLARGWHRQIDRQDNAVLYTPFTPQQYAEWLHDRAVRFVAVPTVQVEPISMHEAEVARTSPDILRPVWSAPGWEVFEVVGATPLIDGGATVLSVIDNDVVLESPTTGLKTLRLRPTSWLRVVEGDACLATDGRWITVDVRRSGRIVLGVRPSWAALRATPLPPRC